MNTSDGSVEQKVRRVQRLQRNSPVDLLFEEFTASSAKQRIQKKQKRQPQFSLELPDGYNMSTDPINAGMEREMK